MTFTLGTAAKACGINKTTVLKAIKNRRLSASRTDTGNWAIEPVELFRVFPPVADTVADTVVGQQETTPQATAFEAEILISSLKQTVGLLRAKLEDIRQDRDEWRKQAKAAQRLLTDLRAPVPAPTMWRRLVG